MNQLVKQLLSSVTNEDLKLAIAEAPESVKSNSGYIQNPLFSKLSSGIKRVEMRVEELNEKGLFYKNKDIYIYVGRGGIKVEETPKGIRKMLLYLSEKYNRRVIISDGLIQTSDKIELSTNGLIDDITIIKDANSLVMGGNILAPYAVVTILSKDDVVIAKKLVIVPNNEYITTLSKMGSVKNQYPTMMATKLAMKRALIQVYSLLGTAISDDDADDFDEIIENQNVDFEEPRSQTKQVQKQADMFDAEVQEIDINEI